MVALDLETEEHLRPQVSAVSGDFPENDPRRLRPQALYAVKRPSNDLWRESRGKLGLEILDVFLNGFLIFPPPDRGRIHAEKSSNFFLGNCNFTAIYRLKQSENPPSAGGPPQRTFLGLVGQSSDEPPEHWAVPPRIDCVR
ncbi:MAG: hypothetical protein JRJ35_12145 [Deltaproteobacteria bacterium]|nr:hypothetical protein [Deltaproteobacteria bacterium]MBW2007744.1 hypothetical protein [Deltaproteobacteria bacterium]